ncbi:MAG: hypothetical protein PF542_04980 [Nanoarchaeota archaeon]|jgi:hypothetical protein|nr:hypothetical protein [Nanoarchaeota archaeon]
MTAFEEIMKLKGQGKSEGEIIATLRAQGVNPMEISDALNQSQIKEAVYDTDPTAGMMPSIMQSEKGEATPAPKANQEQQQQQQAYAPQPSSQPQAPQAYQPTPQEQQQQQTYAPQEQQQQQQAYAPQPPSQPQAPQAYQPIPQEQQQQQAYAPQPTYEADPTYGQKYDQPLAQDNYQNQYGADQYAGEQYDQGEYYDSGYQNSTDTMIEVAEQVFAEKMKKLSQELKNIYEFKTIYQQKVDNLSHRLERMEKNFDKMQLQILDKVGEYGKGINYLRKELNMVEDTMGKFTGQK